MVWVRLDRPLLAVVTGIQQRRTRVEKKGNKTRVQGSKHVTSDTSMTDEGLASERASELRGDEGRLHAHVAKCSMRRSVVGSIKRILKPRQDMLSDATKHAPR